MAEALKFRVGNLIAELLADTLGLGGTLQSAGAITSGLFQTFLDRGDHLGIGIENHFTH